MTQSKDLEKIKEEIKDLRFAICPTEEKEPFFWKWVNHGLNILALYVNEKIEQAIKSRDERLEELAGYTSHEWRCPLSRQDAGEPTESGGYRNKIDGKWYITMAGKSEKLNELPKCICGLDDILFTLSKEEK
jgi:hypothetical protein